MTKIFSSLILVPALSLLLGAGCADPNPNKEVKCVANPHVAKKSFKNTEDINESLVNTFANYLIKMNVGDPAQTLDFVADTGSSNVVAMGANCNGCSSSTNGDYGTYTPPSGASPKATNQPLNYGSGTTSGDGYVDKIGLACQQNPVTSGIWSITQSSGIQDNILGLAYNKPGIFQQIAGAPDKTFFEILVGDYPETKNEFSLTLCGEGGGQSLINFGEKDPRLTDGQIESMLWTDVSEQLYYQIAATDVYVQGQESGATKNKIGTYVGLPANQQPIIDSGTTLMQLPQSIFDSLMAELRKISFSSLPAVPSQIDSGFWYAASLTQQSISDEDMKKLPNIIITLPYAQSSGKSGSFELTITPNRYMKVVPRGDRIFAIQSVPLPPPQLSPRAILGLPFLENFSITFNRENNTIGFYPDNSTICSQTGVN